MTADRLTKQLGIALEAIEAIADGEGTATVIAQQTLDEITRVGMEAIALEREEAPEPTEPAGVAGLADDVERVAKALCEVAQENARRDTGDETLVASYGWQDWIPDAKAAIAALSRTPAVPLEVAKEALEQGAAWFDEYAEQHQAKADNPAAYYKDAEVRAKKAQRNRERAEHLRAALQAIGAEQ